MTIGISEILTTVNKASKKNRVDVLRQHEGNQTLKLILHLAFNPGIKWAVPGGSPPYTENPHVDQHGALYKEMRKLYLFLEGGHDRLTNIKREQHYLAFLESLDKHDAKLMLAVKDHSLQTLYPNITIDLVNEAFPGLVVLEEGVK